MLGDSFSEPERNCYGKMSASWSWILPIHAGQLAPPSVTPVHDQIQEFRCSFLYLFEGEIHRAGDSSSQSAWRKSNHEWEPEVYKEIRVLNLVAGIGCRAVIRQLLTTSFKRDMTLTSFHQRSPSDVSPRCGECFCYLQMRTGNRKY